VIAGFETHAASVARLNEGEIPNAYILAALVHETRLGIPIATMFAESAVRLTGDE